MITNQHIPIMSNEILSFIDKEKKLSILDCTFGGGGHSIKFLEKGHSVTAFDKAEEYYRKALALRKSELGDDAENTLRNLEDLSYCLWAQRKYREVESVLKEVLDIKTRHTIVIQIPLNFIQLVVGITILYTEIENKEHMVVL